MNIFWRFYTPEERKEKEKWKLKSILVETVPWLFKVSVETDVGRTRGKFQIRGTDQHR